ncbi:MAG: hypothetical protein UW84_C0016G0006 [Candidatus Collierbacteria bacterium GW2011_GWA2_44_99]|uniref:Uncharacterized protein n=1 Tax=Candidatus Collierbacteria bacterium GW2011_GWA2_44_99 TaxID=1618380 RepID=A0A0G1MZC0_9BACT|nr:MAG: hypothetical protein UW84_C0016G0006 [Candidatus Collierbacteria bacterium GW2011_GWA2_44_99]
MYRQPTRQLTNSEIVYNNNLVRRKLLTNKKYVPNFTSLRRRYHWCPPTHRYEDHRYWCSYLPITAAVVGLAIVAASWALMQLLSYFFGIDVFSGNINIPKPY